MKLPSSAANSYDTILEERLAAIDQSQTLYWETLVTLGLFIFAIMVLF